MTPTGNHSDLVPIDDAPRYSTLLALVAWLHDRHESDEEVVAAAVALVRSGRVQLTGSFAGCSVEECFAEAL